MKLNYTWEVLKHWMNLCFLGVFVLAGFFLHGAFLVIGGVIEFAVLWVLPAMTVVKRALDLTAKEDRLIEQRWFYLKKLWDIETPYQDPAAKLLAWCSNATTNWSELVSRNYYNRNEDLDRFSRLCRLVAELETLAEVRPEALSSSQLSRLNELINGWLTHLYAVKNAEDSLGGLDRKTLDKEFKAIKGLFTAAGGAEQAGAALGERLRILKEKVDSISVLEQRRDLSRAQADSIAHHIETVSTQVGSSSPTETGSLLDVEVESLVDMSTEMEIASQTRSILSGTDVADPQIWADIEGKLGNKKVPA